MENINMFTSTMTNAELQREAYLDFLELKGPVQIAFGEFRWQNNSSGKKQYYIHNVVKTRTHRTKRNNVWQIEFHASHYNKDNTMIGGYVMYIPIHRGEHTEYLFLRSMYEFSLEKVTSHFVKRYVERYLVPNNINMKGMTPALYFQRNSDDMRPTDFYPDNWSEEDKENKMIWLSNQGLFVTQMEDKMRIYITFLDQENLSRYKAMIYEEENLMRLYNKGKNIENTLEQAKHMAHIFKQPNARNILERYLRRTTDEDAPHSEEYIMQCLNAWDHMMEATFKVLDDVEKYEKKHHDYKEVSISNLLRSM